MIEENPRWSPAEATKHAMTEITAPIVAITMVLLSVFVPVAFIPGISGQLFRQFAVTISVAMLISAVNALTLSPALCAIFLRHGTARRGPMGWVLRRIENVRDGYAAIVRRLVRVSVFGIVWDSQSCLPSWFWWAFTRAGSSHFRYCCRCRSAFWARFSVF